MDALEEARNALKDYEARWDQEKEFHASSLGHLAGRVHTYSLFAQAEALNRLANAQELTAAATELSLNELKLVVEALEWRNKLLEQEQQVMQSILASDTE